MVSSVSFAFLAKLTLLSLLASAEATFTPTRISWDNLRAVSSSGDDALGSDDSNNDTLLLDTLRQVGLVSLTNIPHLSSLKHKTLEALAACIQDDPQVAATHVFDDGTVRRTLATHSLPAAPAMPDIPFRGVGDDHNTPVPPSCQRLQAVSADFRQLVQDAAQAFAARLQGLVLQEPGSNHQNVASTEPLLRTRGSEEETAYLGLAEAVYHGEHLEHFHAYERFETDNDQNSLLQTVDWHLDQGLFLVFTPGVQQGKPSDGFYVQLSDGSKEMVRFEEQDDLIILLGDAMHQILNPVLKEPLRIPPHALTVPQGQRFWYGRMVLPPANALVPTAMDLTYGELRHELISSVHNPQEEALSSSAIGCSSPMLQARHLEEADCHPETQFFCWHRCFNLTQELTRETCQAQNETLECINDQRQLWHGGHDMAFKPGCVDKTTAVQATFAPTDPTTDAPTTMSPSSSSFSTMVVSAVWGTVAAAAVVLFG